jgi:hypothetical protein
MIFYHDPDGPGPLSYVIVDLTQQQPLANWHTDDDGDGEIAITPDSLEVCEKDPLFDHTFFDASTFACTDPVALSQPNNVERWVQFVYGTTPSFTQGIPFITIDVHGTTVQLTDEFGNPVPNLWTVNPLDGSTVPGYSTNSGYFEGPVISTGPSPITGSQETFPISYPAGYTVAGDYFEVTVRNWNYCNPWNNQQPYPPGSPIGPNEAIARKSTARIVVIDAPDPPAVASRTICFGDVNRTLTVTSPVVGTIRWFSDAALTNEVETGTSYTIPSTTPDIYDVWVIDDAISGTGCSSQPTLASLTIRQPIPAPGDISGLQVVCQNTPNVSYTVTDAPPTLTPGGPTEYVWTLPSGMSFVSGQGSETIVVNIGSTTGNRTISVRGRYVDQDPSCLTASKSIIVNVVPLPVGTSATKASVCGGTAFNFNPQSDISNGVTSTFAWSASYAAGLSGGAGSGTGNIAETLTNLSGSTLNAVYTVTPTSVTGSCPGTPFTITVPIKSLPVGSNSTRPEVCSGVSFTYNPQGNITNGMTSTFTWTATYQSGLSGGAASGSGNISGTVINTYGSTRNAVFTVTPVSGGCAGATFTITVPIKSAPAGSNSTKAQVCSGTTFNFNPQDNITNGLTSTFSWTASYGTGISGGAGSGTGNINETLINLSGSTRNAVYTVTPTSTLTGCTGPTFTITVPVRSAPVGSNTTKSAVCSGTAFNFILRPISPMVLPVHLHGRHHIRPVLQEVLPAVPAMLPEHLPT